MIVSKTHFILKIPMNQISIYTGCHPSRDYATVHLGDKEKEELKDWITDSPARSTVPPENILGITIKVNPYLPEGIGLFCDQRTWEKICGAVVYDDKEELLKNMMKCSVIREEK